jgi:hypothetical protein
VAGGGNPQGNRPASAGLFSTKAIDELGTGRQNRARRCYPLFGGEPHRAKLLK